MAAKEKKGLGTGLAALFADADILQDDAPLKVRSWRSPSPATG